MPQAELQGLTVVEVSGSVAGAYCAKVFADRGANVLLTGQPTITSHQIAYMNPAKVAVDVNSIDWSSVDVVIESSAPDPLTPLDLDGAHLVRVQISPFGNSGPYADWKSTDLVDYAMSGHSYLYGDPERAPLRGPADQPAIASGLFGFIGAMAALFARSRGAPGQTVDVSHMQVMVALHQVTLLRWQMSQSVARRVGNRYTGPGQPNGPYLCKDGWVSIACVTPPQVEGLLAVTGLTDLMDHPDISSPLDFQSHPHVLDEPLERWLSTQLVDDVAELFQAMRIPTCPLRSPLELLDDPQLSERDFWHQLGGPGEVLAPRPPFTISHQQLGSTSWQPSSDLAADDRPLAGLRVLDLARVWAGPLCARILSDLGAEVVWVEAPWSRGPREVPQSMLDAAMYFAPNESGERQWNRNTHFVKYSLGKQSLALDLQAPEGRATFERLVPHFDVLLENFSTRVMPQFGLDESKLHDVHPGLIYLTMPGYGRSGPAENWLAYGSTVDSHAGLSALIGYADETPWKGGVAWPDPVAGLHACCAVLTALWDGAESTSDAGGVTIEAAQFESTLAAIGDRIVEAQVDGPAVPDGNRQADLVAQGMYRCRDHDVYGSDQWIAISLPDDPALSAIEHLTGGSLHGADHDAIDRALSAFTASRDAMELTHELQALGVPAGPVLTAPAILDDQHLGARGAWVTLDQPDVGTFTAPQTPLTFSHSSVGVRSPAPTFGQHNHQILAAAGFADDEIAALIVDGIIVDAPPES